MVHSLGPSVDTLQERRALVASSFVPLKRFLFKSTFRPSSKTENYNNSNSLCLCLTQTKDSESPGGEDGKCFLREKQKHF